MIPNIYKLINLAKELALHKIKAWYERSSSRKGVLNLICQSTHLVVYFKPTVINYILFYDADIVFEWILSRLLLLYIILKKNQSSFFKKYIQKIMKHMVNTKPLHESFTYNPQVCTYCTLLFSWSGSAIVCVFISISSPSWPSTLGRSVSFPSLPFS